MSIPLGQISEETGIPENVLAEYILRPELSNEVDVVALEQAGYDLQDMELHVATGE